MHFSLKLLTINKIEKKCRKVNLAYYVPPALWHSNASCSWFTKLYFFPTTPFPLTVQSQNNLYAKVLVQRRVSFKPRHFSCQHPTEGVAFLFGVRETESKHITESRSNLAELPPLSHTSTSNTQKLFHEWNKWNVASSELDTLNLVRSRWVLRILLKSEYS